MKKSWWIILGVLLMGIVVMAVIPKNKEIAVNKDSPYKFYYYPKLNAYYDLQKEQFVYSLDGGRTWLKKKPSSGTAPENLSKKVIIAGHTQEPWTLNEAHRKAYKGYAYNFIDRKEEKEAKTITTAATRAEPLRLPEEEAVHYEAELPKIRKEQPEVIIIEEGPDEIPAVSEQEWEAVMEQEASRLIRKGISKGKDRVLKDKDRERADREIEVVTEE